MAVSFNRIVVLGRSGQVARHLQRVLPEATFLGRGELDLARPGAAQRHLEELRPDCIVNAAAYTAVDAAEDDFEAAHRINAGAVAEVAATADRVGAALLHLSTDYVFDGAIDRDYHEQHATNPLNVYGATKLAGETSARSLCERHWVIRTSWVFSEYGSNFVKTMLRVGAERERLGVVCDQIGRPTYAGHLAVLIAHLVRGGASALPWGLYHFAAGRSVSWAEFARIIFEQAHRQRLLPSLPVVDEITTAEYPTRAARPARAVLDGSLLQRHLGATAWDWEVALATMLAALFTESSPTA